MTATSTPTRTAGFTLIELVSAIALLTIFSSAALTLAATLLNSNERCANYAADVLGARRSLRAFGEDVRTATRVTTEPSAAHLEGPNGDVTYRLVDGALTRSDGSHETPLARSIASVDIWREGQLVHMRLTLAARRKGGHHLEAAMSTSVRMRTRRAPKVVIK